MLYARKHDFRSSIHTMMGSILIGIMHICCVFVKLLPKPELLQRPGSSSLFVWFRKLNNSNNNTCWRTFPILIQDQMLLEFMDSIIPYPFNQNIALPQHVGTKCYWSLCIGEGSGNWGSCLEASGLRGGVEILGRYWPQGGAEIPGSV